MSSGQWLCSFGSGCRAVGQPLLPGEGLGREAGKGMQVSQDPGTTPDPTEHEALEDGVGGEKGHRSRWLCQGSG